MMLDFVPNDIFADEEKINTRSFSFENTSIIEFTNSGVKEIKTIRIWIVDNNIISFKSENGWTATVNSQNVIIFTSLEPLKQNEIVKFGIISEKSNPLFQWDVLGNDGNSIDLGQTLPNFESSLGINEPQLVEDATGILSDSVFTVAPKSIHPGSTIRVIGDNFAPNSILKLFLDTSLLQSFETDDDGNFISTSKIPTKTKIGQINLILKDVLENEKIIRINLTDIEKKVSKNIDLTVSEIQDKFFRTEKIEFSGTVNPDTLIIIKTTDSFGNLFSTKTTNSDSMGDWSISNIVPLDTPIDTYTTQISDGKNTILKSWDVVLSKQIHVSSTKLTFFPEDLMIFNGTAIPDKNITIKLVNPKGSEVLSTNFVVAPSGFFKVEYSTFSSTLQGTYVLYVFQEGESEIIFVGLGQYPKKIISTALNNVNYFSNDVALIGITGDPSQDVTLSILDENDHEKFTDNVELGPDGKRNYYLNLSEFYLGVYTVLVSMAGYQDFDMFTVDLPSNSMPIDLNILEKKYSPTQLISVLGTSAPHTFVDLFLIDSNGFLINQKETFADKNGNLFVKTFTIPSDASFGNWVIRSQSGTISENYEFQVVSLGVEDLSISVTEIISSSVGTFVTIEGFTTEKQDVFITIESEEGTIVFQKNIPTIKNGEFDLLWTAKSKHIPGTYTVTVKDSVGNTASVVFDL